MEWDWADIYILKVFILLNILWDLIQRSPQASKIFSEECIGKIESAPKVAKNLRLIFNTTSLLPPLPSQTRTLNTSKGSEVVERLGWSSAQLKVLHLQFPQTPLAPTCPLPEYTVSLFVPPNKTLNRCDPSNSGNKKTLFLCLTFPLILMLMAMFNWPRLVYFCVSF